MGTDRLRSSPLLVGALSVVMGAGLVLVQGAVAPEEVDGTIAHPEPATVVPDDSGGPATVTLTEEAAERIDLQSESVEPWVTGADDLAVPYAALLYDPDGKTWVYTRTEELSFRRAPVTVASVVGEHVLVRNGPPAGTDVVTTGAAELWGAELGIGY